MCLIIVGKAEKLRATLLNTQGLLEDIYKSNPDGIGIMYANERRGLRIFKSLPKTASAARHFLTRLPGDERNLAVHFRWTTHGHTNKFNCHPYTVVENECALMHNGVLRTGNSADRSKSDTWHFIENYLKTGAALAPQIVHDDGFKSLVKEFIGTTNRFVLMTKDGTTSIINAREGIEHDGLWFSNTYAWTPGMLIESRRNQYNGYQGGSYQGGQFRGGSPSQHGYGGVHGYRGGMHGDDDFDGYGVGYGGGRYPASSSPSTYQQQTGGAQSGGAKSGDSVGGGAVTHTTGTTQATRYAHRAPVVSKEDEAEEAAWRRTVSQTQRGANWQSGAGPNPPWPNTATGSRPSTAASSGGAAGGARSLDHGDEPEEGTSGASAANSAGQQGIVPWGPPSLTSMTEALLSADVETFSRWLEHYAVTTTLMLFKNWKAVPTKWCKQNELDGYASFIYEGCINGDRQLLVNESQDLHGSYASVAEVICYYLNWLSAEEREAVATLTGDTSADLRGITDRLDRVAALVEGAEQRREETLVDGKVVASTDGKHGVYPFPVSAHKEPEHVPVTMNPPNVEEPEQGAGDPGRVGVAGTDLPNEIVDAVKEAKDDSDNGYAYISM